MSRLITNKVLASFAGLLILAASSGCVANNGDPYSVVASLCKTQDPRMGQYISYDPAVLAETYLTPECKKALETVIPYDNESFAAAPTGFKDKITEAFQALIAYPIEVTTDSKFLGVSPQLAGAIPLDFYTIYSQSSNPNQALFNFILNQVDQYSFATDGGEGETSRYFPALSSQPRRVKFFRAFWDPSADPLEYFRNPFARASTLAHESYHGTGILHENCDPAKTQGNSGFSCDGELHGPYGFGATYLKFLLHGSAVCSTPGCSPPMSETNVMLTGYEICNVATRHLNNRFVELQALLGTISCDTTVTADWVLKQEGLANAFDTLPADSHVLKSHGPGASGTSCTAH